MSLSNDNRAYRELEKRFGQAARISGAQTVLFWDAQTNMPRGGAWSRGEQLAALAEAAHDLVAAPEVSDRLQEAQEAADALEPAEQANLIEMRRLWTHRAGTPKDLLAEKTRLTSTLQPLWREAKANNDFALFAPGLEKMISLFQEVAAIKAEQLGAKPYDALMDEMDPGLTTDVVDVIFDDLETALPALLAETLELQAGWDKPLPFDGDFSPERQAALTRVLVEAVGHSWEHVRVDPAPHPFALTGSPGDVRFTSRFDADNIRFGIMATLHEAGHAMYEFNLPRDLAFTPAGSARGATAHESQSLMVEMQAGRSAEFLSWLAPKLREAFGGSQEAYSASNVLNSWRRVGEGFIRVEADEISYPLHIILRYRIERALLSGALKVVDIPAAWNELSQKLFGRTPPTDSVGCLQDIHWSMGLFAYFPNYALGETLAAQLFEKMTADDPNVLSGLSKGTFAPYFDWVRPRIHQRASLAPFETIVKDAVGEPLSAAALKRGLRRRYLEEAL